MVSDEDLRELRILADQYRISQKCQSDDWPSAHDSTFQCIQALSQTSFQTYIDSINRQSDNELWRRQNKARAEWLAEQAGRLARNTANESAWRMRIENAILERFSVEVACPICKYRLWRSEIESTFTGSSRMWAELDQRRLQRGPCKCLLEDRPQDRYEIGTSRLFEDQVEEPFVHHDPLGLPKQKPDRIVGLRETNNIRQLLDQPPQVQSDNNLRKVRDRIRCSPFKRQSNPLLFPFLVLEAKSDSARNSFSDIQTQTAFPIWSLLNLQKDLQSFIQSDKGRPEPLVWFLGYKGSDWKVYGCYLGLDSESKPTYNIHYLRSGDIATKDGALQLLLLVDYIVDWARDTFRPSIIAQLSSLATGKDFDEVSLGPDSDIVSKDRTIRDWISRVPSIVVQGEAARPLGNKPIHPEGHNDILSVRLPNTKFGVVRPVSTMTFQLAGLRLTEGNVESLLTLSDGFQSIDPRHQGTNFSPCARRLVNEITRWDEVLVVLGADLDNIERVWTDEERMTPEPFDEGPGTEFYAIFEYRCFMNLSWEIIRELSYLAISKLAFTVLVKHAAFQKRHPRIESFPKTLRECSGALIKETIDCLRSGSPWQVFHSAVSSTLLSLYPEPERRRDDFSPSVASLGLGYPRSVRVRFFIEKYMNVVEKSPPNLKKRMLSSKSDRKRYKAEIDAWEEKTCNRSFRRMSRRAVQVLEAFHDPSECTRCRGSNQDLFALKYWDQENIPSPTAYGAVLVASLEEEPEGFCEHQQRHDLSLFILENSFWMEDEVSISTVVEDLVQNNSIYHAIRHGPLMNVGGSRAVLWNLPSPYRRSTKRQRWDIARWVTELNGEPIPKSDLDFSTESTPLWVHQQMLLHFLRGNMPYDDALASLIKFRDEKRKEFYKLLKQRTGTFSETKAHCVRLDEFLDKVSPHRFETQSYPWLPEKLQLRGE